MKALLSLDHNSRSTLWLYFIFFFALCLAIGRVHTKHPWTDEGWFANPAVSIKNLGHSGTTVIEESGRNLNGINNKTMWVPPISFVTKFLWSTVFGQSLISFRMEQVFWFFIFLFAVVVIGRKLELTGSAFVFLLATIATNNIILADAADARMDMQMQAFTFSSIAVFLSQYQRAFARALILSACLITLAGLTHPHGFIGLVDLLIVIFMLSDRKELSIKNCCFFGAPFVLGAIGWSWFIIPNWSDFLHQFGQNSGARFGGYSLRTMLTLEIQRYLEVYGFKAGMPYFAKVKALLLVVFVISTLHMFYQAIKNRRRPQTMLSAMVIFNVMFLAFAQPNKAGYYLLSVLPYFCFALALATEDLKGKRVRWAFLLPCFVVALQVAINLFAIRKQDLGRSYRPVIALLKQVIATHPDVQIFGPPELGFELGFDRNVIEDTAIGYFSHKKADIFVIDGVYRDNLEARRQQDPQFAEYEQTVLSTKKLIFQTEFYTVYSSL